jgi:hypothetical protein
MKLSEAKWSDLTEMQPRETWTNVEKQDPYELLPDQHEFVAKGVCYLPKFIPDEVIDLYRALREQLPKERSKRDNYWNGWHYPAPYMAHDELKDIALYAPLMEKLRELLGGEAGLHVCITDWVSPELDFHQISYLNPAYIWSNHVAVWIALEDIDPLAGPFQFVEGSHRWETIRRNKLFEYLKESSGWPAQAHGDISRVCLEKIMEMKAEVTTYVPKRGDVLVWHSNLIQRESPPLNKELMRRSLICHYTNVQACKEMPKSKRYPPTNGIYFEQYVPTLGKRT